MSNDFVKLINICSMLSYGSDVTLEKFVKKQKPKSRNQLSSIELSTRVKFKCDDRTEIRIVNSKISLRHFISVQAIK